MEILWVGVWKLNVDVVKIGDWGRGWGWEIRDCIGEVVVMGIE